MSSKSFKKKMSQKNVYGYVIIDTNENKYI